MRTWNRAKLLDLVEQGPVSPGRPGLAIRDRIFSVNFIPALAKLKFLSGKILIDIVGGQSERASFQETCRVVRLRGRWPKDKGDIEGILGALIVQVLKIAQPGGR